MPRKTKNRTTRTEPVPQMPLIPLYPSIGLLELDRHILEKYHKACALLRDYYPGETEIPLEAEAVIVVRNGHGKTSRMFCNRSHLLPLLSTIDTEYLVQPGSRVEAFLQENKVSGF